MNHLKAMLIVMALFALLLTGACNNNSSSGGGSGHTVSGYSLSLLKGEWFYSAPYAWGRMTIDAGGVVTKMTSSHCAAGDPVTAHITFGVTASGAAVGHGLFECTKQPASSMKADSVKYDLQFTTDGNRLDGTVEIKSSSGNISEKIIFERR